MSPFIQTNLYFSGFLFALSGLLLLLLYFIRWKSDATSFLIWLLANGTAGLLTWVITQDTMATAFAMALNLFLAAVLSIKLAHILSLFGVFFLISMITPPLFFLYLLFTLVNPVAEFFDMGWPGLILASSIALIFGILILFNLIMGSWVSLSRFSALYFRFPRTQAAWKAAKETKANANFYPYVSIHVPCCSEPPEMVIATLDALANLRYPHFEVIVIDNNTKDPALWQPVEAHCHQLGDRFHFFHFDSLKGAKAGALNKALALTSPQAELIAVVDADYIVQPDFLEDLTRFFADPKTGFVQSCHDYHSWENSVYASACYYEYGSHFKLVLPGQNEWDVTYTVGTMCLLRRKAIEEAGGWAEWCLTEDSEIAVRLHNLGYAGYYLQATYGRGIIPKTFEGYKIQRFRWSAGPIQQIQKHWRLYLPWSSSSQLTPMQKAGEFYHSMWYGLSEAMYLLINIPLLLVCLWSAMTVQRHFIIPYSLLIFLPIGIVRSMMCNWVQIKLLGGNWKDALRSALAARSLIYTRKKAFYLAWFGNNLKWKRTDKFEPVFNPWKALNECRAELSGGILYFFLVLIFAPFALYMTPDIILMILLGLLNQGFSYLCAPLMSYLAERELYFTRATGKEKEISTIS